MSRTRPTSSELSALQHSCRSCEQRAGQWCIADYWPAMATIATRYWAVVLHRPRWDALAEANRVSA